MHPVQTCLFFTNKKKWSVQLPLALSIVTTHKDNREMQGGQNTPSKEEKGTIQVNIGGID